MRRIRLVLLVAAFAALTGAAEALATVSPPPDPTISTVLLPMQTIAASAVNPANGDLYVADSTGDQVLVRGGAGAAVGTISVTDPVSVAASPDGKTIWVASSSSDQVVSYDATTLAVTHTYQLTTAAGCPTSVVAGGTNVWVSYACGGIYQQGSGLVRIVPGTHADTEFPVMFGTSGSPSTQIVAPNSTTLIGEGGGQAWKVDIGDPTAPNVTATENTSTDCGGGQATDIANVPGSGTVALACVYGSVSLVSLHVSDLTLASTYRTDSAPLPMAVTADTAGHVYFYGFTYSGDPGSALFVYPTGASTPVEQYANYGSDNATIRGGLAVAADGSTLYTLSYDAGAASDGVLLRMIGSPATPRGIVTASPSSVSVVKGQQVTVTGNLLLSDETPQGGTMLTVTRDNQDGSHTPLSDVAVVSDGSFGFTDTPTQAGTATYEIAYAGDVTHAAGSADASISVTLPVPTLSLTRSAKQITYGTRVTLTAQLSAHGTNSNVTLLGNGVPVATLPVDGTGGVSFSVKPARDTTYQASYAGDETEGPKTSASVSVAVAWRVRQKMIGGYGTRLGYRLYHYKTSCPTTHTYCPTLVVSVAPDGAHKYVNIQFEARVGGRWQILLDRGERLSATGRFTLKIVYSSRSIIGTPLRARLGLLATPSTIVAVRPPWMYSRVTT
jgi:hypothetical protein